MKPSKSLSFPRAMQHWLPLFFCISCQCWQLTFAQQADSRQVLQNLQQTCVGIIEEAEGSVVAIARIKATPQSVAGNNFNPLNRAFAFQNRRPVTNNPNSPDFIPNEFGTGVVVARHPETKNTGELLVLTNYHLVRGGPIATAGGRRSDNRIYIRLANRRGFDARILAADPRCDLAILTVDAPGVRQAGVKPIKLGNAAQIKKGHFVFALGNPYAIARDGSASASWGFVSNVSRFPLLIDSATDPETDSKETIHHYGTLLHIDSRLSLGTSGGALLNIQGELVGLTTSLAALEGYEKSTGYAIPIDTGSRRIIDALLQGFEVEYGFLGIVTADVLPEELAAKYSRQFRQPSAAKAGRIIRNAPADIGGVAFDDLILAVDGRPIYGRYDLIREIGLLGPQAIATLRIWRERTRELLNLPVKLAKWPVDDEESIIATRSRYSAAQGRGLLVDFPSSRRKYMQSDFSYPQAVVITGIAPQSHSALTGKLAAGDFITHVNETPVLTPEEFYAAVGGVNADLTLHLIDGRQILVHK